MATIIDELLVTLGLDSSKFKTEASQTQATINRVGEGARKQSSQLEDSLKKHQTETTKRLKQVGEVGESTYKNFNKLRLEVLALFSTLATGYGLQEFIKNVTTTEVGLGRLSSVVGISVQDLDAFGQATDRMGGDAKAAQQSLAGFAQALETMSLTGKPASFLPTLQLMGIDISGVMKHLPGAMEKLWRDINKWMLAHPGPTGFNRLAELGLGGAYPILGAPDMQAELDKVRKTGVTTPEDVKRGQEFVASLHDIDQSLTKLGQTIVNDYVKDIKQVLDGMTDWIGVNKDWLKADIEGGITKAIQFIKDFLGAVKEVVEAVGGWKNATQIVLGLWAGFQVLPIVAALTSITAAMVSLGSATGVVSGLFSVLTGPAGIILAAVGALGGMIWDDERIKKHNKEHPEDPIETWYDMLARKWNGAKGFLGQHFGGASDERQADVRDQLSQRLGISSDAAAGLTNNLNAESGIQGINEVNPTSGRGGFGWAQWTGPRRVDFEGYAGQRGLDPASDEANMGFLVEELTTKYPQILAQLRRGDISAREAADIVARGYIIPPADKIQGHVSGAEGLARLPSRNSSTTGDYSSVVVGPWGAHAAGYDAALSNLIRTPTAAATISNNNSRSVNQTSEVHTGPISIHVANGDPDSIARGVGASLRKYAFVSTANVGLA
jgi:hypothetical protein